jgi:hypothetical protein
MVVGFISNQGHAAAGNLLSSGSGDLDGRTVIGLTSRQSSSAETIRSNDSKEVAKLSRLPGIQEVSDRAEVTATAVVRKVRRSDDGLRFAQAAMPAAEVPSPQAGQKLVCIQGRSACTAAAAAAGDACCTAPTKAETAVTLGCPAHGEKYPATTVDTTDNASQPPMQPPPMSGSLPEQQQPLPPQPLLLPVPEPLPHPLLPVQRTLPLQPLQCQQQEQPSISRTAKRPQRTLLQQLSAEQQQALIAGLLSLNRPNSLSESQFWDLFVQVLTEEPAESHCGEPCFKDSALPTMPAGCDVK